MKIHHLKSAVPVIMTHALRPKNITTPDDKVESEGFCICPKCFHLVFDEMLTGTCPWCRFKFCPSFSVRHTTPDKIIRR